MKRRNLLHPSQRIRLIRYISQGFVVLLLVYFGVRHQMAGSGPQNAAPIDSYCAFGGVETVWNYVTTGSFLPKTNISNFVLIGAAIMLTVLTGASFCGWICPLGTIQDVLAKLGKKIFGRTFVPPPSVDRYLRPLRYVSLVLILYMTVRLGTLWFSTYDPFRLLFHFSFDTALAFVLVIMFVLLSIVSERFWCKYLCPLGGFFSLFSHFSLFKLKRNPTVCTSCKLCTKSCPVGLKVSQAEVLNDGQCIKCLNCVVACPIKGALVLESKRR